MIPDRVVEAYRLDRYDNIADDELHAAAHVVEAYRLDRYDNYPQEPAASAWQL